MIFFFQHQNIGLINIYHFNVQYIHNRDQPLAILLHYNLVSTLFFVFLNVGFRSLHLFFFDCLRLDHIKPNSKYHLHGYCSDICWYVFEHKDISSAADRNITVHPNAYKKIICCSIPSGRQFHRSVPESQLKII